MIHWTGVLVFALCYLLISLPRLPWLGFDRPAGALLGAVLVVALGVLPPDRALEAVDGSTIVLLFGVMGLGAFLDLDGFFAALESKLIAVARTPARLLGLLVWGSGVLAAFVTNDAVCVLGAPLVVRLIKRHGLPPLPFLLALATAANTGSVATLVGNPQNMLCASLGGLSYRQHLMWLGPVALIGLAINHAILHVSFRRSLSEARLSSAEVAAPLSASARTTLGVIVGTAVVCTFGASLPWTATGAFVLLMLLHRRDTSALWQRIDWSLLLFFAGLFVVVDGFVHSGAPAAFFARVPLPTGEGGLPSWLGLSALFALGSNVVSNVPFIVLIGGQMDTLVDPTLGWEMLAMASTFAGNLTLLGSVANLIVAEQAHEIGGIGFWQYLRVGLPVSLITTVVGVIYLVMVVR